MTSFGGAETGDLPHRHATPALGSRLAWLLLFVVLAGLIWLPRGLDLDRLVTPDEPLWLARSANFAKGLADGNLDQTYQYAHPGVTVMWAGTLGYLWRAPDYVANGPATVRQSNNRIAGELQNLNISPLRTLAATRQMIVLFVVASLVATAWFAMRMFGVVEGLIGTLILATDPYHVALSRLLHLDGLESSILGLAALAWLTYLLKGRKRSDLIIAGVAVGLAGLTRSIAAVLLPMILLSALLERGADFSHGAPVWRTAWARLRPVVVVGLIALATFVLFWPAMWTSPVHTVEMFVTVGLELGQRAHSFPIFFNGEVYATDPGVLFYPVSFIWRTTPALLAGLLLAVAAVAAGLFARGRTAVRTEHIRAIAYLLVLVMTVLLVLVQSDKKLDRYILPVVPPFAFIAGWGYGAAGRWIARRVPIQSGLPTAGLAAGALSAVLIAWNVVAIVQTHPYGLNYYNPLLGGASAAHSTMMIGWGEGADQVSHAIAEIPDAAERRVITSTWRTSLDYFVGAPTISPFSFTADGALVNWLRSDYYVWYITPDQRGYIPPEMQAYFDALQPIKAVQLSGVTYAALYDLTTAPFPAYFTNQAWMVEIAPGVRLVTATLPEEPRLPNENVTTVLYVTGAPTTGDPATVQLTMVGPDGVSVVGEPQSVSIAAGDTVWSLRRRIKLPEAAAFGTYWVTARFVSGSFSQDVVLGSVVVGDAPVPVEEPVEVDILEEAWLADPLSSRDAVSTGWMPRRILSQARTDRREPA